MLSDGDSSCLRESQTGNVPEEPPSPAEFAR